jgi:undecaprenyl diphosphate synthase
MDLKNKINIAKLPKHIAIIMDGNGRWAKQQGANRIFGHQSGVTAVRETVEAAAELGVQYLTLYAFSTENWSRPKEEVMALMQLLVQTIHAETKTLNDNSIKLQAIGDLKSLPSDCLEQLQETINQTANNARMTLVLALSYSSRWEITNALSEIGKLIEDKKIKATDINETLINAHLCTANFPEPELMIRTSGEHRISNFLLWQLAYSELYFTETLWPDFRKDNFYEAIIDYQNRERRFGKTSEQLTP